MYGRKSVLEKKKGSSVGWLYFTFFRLLTEELYGILRFPKQVSRRIHSLSNHQLELATRLPPASCRPPAAPDHPLLAGPPPAMMARADRLLRLKSASGSLLSGAARRSGGGGGFQRAAARRDYNFASSQYASTHEI